MLFLTLSILVSTLLGFIMTWFERFKVNMLQAVVVNYYTCVLTAWAITGSFPITTDSTTQTWFPYAAGVSVFFITGFTVVGYTYHKFGVTVTTIMTKMSMIVSVLFAVLVYNELINFPKIAGILLAILSIILTNLPHEKSVYKQQGFKKIYWILPLIVILVQGIIEIVLQYAERNVLSTSGDPAFISTIFFLAGSLGVPIILYSLWAGRSKLSWRNVAGGIILGIPNYFSIYFLMKALGSGLEGSVVFPVNNVGIIALSAVFGGFLIFKEKYSKLNILGIVLSIAAILLIAFGGS